MEEKIKIYIPETINNILLKDMERFEFFKKDGSFNKNEFYNTLILNYYEQYQQHQATIFDYVKKTINDNLKGNELTINDVASKILEYVDIKTNQLDEQKAEIALAIKPTRKTSAIFDYITDCCLGACTLSSYFRNMFASYSLLPQDKRERIIFKHNFELIDKALKEKRKLYFTMPKNDTMHIVSAYSLCNSKEELFNYLLCEYNEYPYSFRVSRLQKLRILNEPIKINENNLPIFKKMQEQGPQYSYKVSQASNQIKVFLSDKGKELYKLIYLHRPKCSKVEDNYYYFDCSLEQAFQYFSRFGKNALVVEPLELVKDLNKFYIAASKAYKKLSS